MKIYNHNSQQLVHNTKCLKLKVYRLYILQAMFSHALHKTLVKPDNIWLKSGFLYLQADNLRSSATAEQTVYCQEHWDNQDSRAFVHPVQILGADFSLRYIIWMTHMLCMYTKAVKTTLLITLLARRLVCSVLQKKYHLNAVFLTLFANVCEKNQIAFCLLIHRRLNVTL